MDVHGYTSFVLPPEEVNRLAALDERFRFAYPVKPEAHRITHEYGVDIEASLPKTNRIEIIGIANDGKGIQALVVRVGGEYERRPDGRPYFIAWSYDPSRE